MDTRTSPFRLRIEKARDALAQHQLAALLVPSSDPHLSEYLPDRWQGRIWLSGFTGSMGTIVVTAHHAALFADSRYWVQAEAQIAGTGVAARAHPHRRGHPPHRMDGRAPEGRRHRRGRWPGARARRGATSCAAHSRRPACTCAPTSICFAEIWPDRPALPAAPVYEHRSPHAPLARTAKLAQVREAMARHGASHHFVSTVDDIAWITNLRGGDVDYNPVFLAHLLIEATRATLFVARRQGGRRIAGSARRGRHRPG